MEKITRAAGLNIEGAIFYRSEQLLAYANVIVMIYLNRALSSTFSRLNKKSKDRGMEVSELRINISNYQTNSHRIRDSAPT